MLTYLQILWLECKTILHECIISILRNLHEFCHEFWKIG